MLYQQQLFGAWRGAGLDASPRTDGGLTFCCPACVHPTRLDVDEGLVLCPVCGWGADGEPWTVAAAAVKALPQAAQVEPGKEAGAKDYAALLADRRFDASNPPPAERVVYSINGTEICHAGNITTLEAHIKGGKSAFTAAAIASTFARPGSDCLGWQSANPHGHAVLHFDTEQSRGDHHKLLMRALARGGSPQPPWLESYCITGFSCEDMQGAISDRVAYATAKFGGVHSLFLDGAADPVNDINDPKESFAFVSWLHATAIKGAFPILGVIHLNPGDSGKSRGHLGSQLNRKSEHVLKLTRSGDISTVVSSASRGAPLPVDATPCFEWNDQAGRHITVQGGHVVTKPKAASRPQAFSPDEILSLIGPGWVTYTQAFEMCKQEGWKPTQFKQAWASLKLGKRLVESVMERGCWGAKK